MEACAAEAVVVVLLFRCSDNREDRYFQKPPFSGFFVFPFLSFFLLSSFFLLLVF